MSSIYTITDWSQSLSYLRNDIVKKDNKIYYAIKDVNANKPFSLDNFAGYYKIGQERPYFLWKPSFGSNININTKLIINQFDEGVEQRTEDGINFDSLEIDLSFSQRNDSEARAIFHFLNARAGKESFYFIPPFPYEVMKIFICQEWQHSLDFAGSHTINARFLERYN